MLIRTRTCTWILFDQLIIQWAVSSFRYWLKSNFLDVLLSLLLYRYFFLEFLEKVLFSRYLLRYPKKKFCMCFFCNYSNAIYITSKYSLVCILMESLRSLLNVLAVIQFNYKRYSFIFDSVGRKTYFLKNPSNFWL